MKLLLAATLVLSAISQDETSLMQGLVRGSETSTSVLLPPPPGQQATLCSLGSILLHCAAAGVASVACQVAVERLELSVLQMCGTGATETENQCRCKGGTAATGTECPANDAYKCSSCNEGWLQVTDDTCAEQLTWSDAAGSCVSKESPDLCSTCPYAGFAVVSCIDGQRCIYEHALDNCAALRVDTATGDLKCSSCNQGWWLPGIDETPMCIENQCRCDCGTGATGTECPANDAYKCSSVGSTTTPAPPAPSLQTIVLHCAASSGGACSSCDSGYYLNSDTQSCEENQCTCAGGTGVTRWTGTDCPTNGDYMCPCDEGYWFLLDNCRANQCYCTGGTGTTGTECPTNGATMCALCDSFSQHVSSDMQSCEDNECFCDLGTVGTGACHEHGKSWCIDCPAGYRKYYRAAGLVCA